MQNIEYPYEKSFIVQGFPGGVGGAGNYIKINDTASVMKP